MPINILNRRWDRGGEYIGRPSPLGNPFRIGPDGATRDVVIDLYARWLDQKIQERDPAICGELERLRRIAEKGTLELSCWCAPRRCHGDEIADRIAAALREGRTFEVT